jgi:two-component system alkaline phosphatase synthesis response regulator PhoP
MTKILIVEDEPGIAMALEDDLRSEGYEIEVLRDGAAASRRACEEAFDAVLLDIMLPQKDGLEVCRDIRRAGIRTPVIMLTAKNQEADKIVGLDTGADDYVTKPYSPRELRARIRAALRRSKDGHEDIYRFGDIEVDFTRYEVRRCKRPVPMTPLEMKVLMLLIRNRGRALTRRQVIDHSWGRGIFVIDRVVDNQITNLRRKIEPDPSKPRYLVNVRGVGYRFDG